MVRSVIVALGTAVMAASALCSCTDGPGREDVAIQRLETALCEKRAECGCEAVEPEICGRWPLVDQFGNERRPPPLAFDAECQERWLTWVDELSCQRPALPGFAEVCPLYHGTIREGMECTDGGIVQTSCGRGLLCIAGTCRNPRTTSFGGFDQRCDLGDRCDDERALCVDGWCQRLPGTGEPCLRFECTPDHTCIDDQCIPLPLVGEPCFGTRDSCTSEAFCDLDPNTGEGRCEPVRGVGQPCQGHRDCRSGNCPAGTCASPAEVGDPCSSNLPCGPDSFCSDGICQARVEGTVLVGSVCELLSSVR